MTANQWELVKQMCYYKAKNRPTASIIVRELATLVHKESGGDLGMGPIADLDHLKEVSTTLTAIDKMCSSSTATDRMHRDLYERLADVFSQLTAHCDSMAREAMQRYRRILRYFQKKLELADTASSALTTSYAASRQVADDIFQSTVTSIL